MHVNFRWLWPRGRPSVLLLQGCWFDFPVLDVGVGKILNPKTAPDVLVGTSHGSRCRQCMNVYMNYASKSLWTKTSARCRESKYLWNQILNLDMLSRQEIRNKHLNTDWIVALLNQVFKQFLPEVSLCAVSAVQACKECAGQQLQSGCVPVLQALTRTTRSHT